MKDALATVTAGGRLPTVYGFQRWQLSVIPVLLGVAESLRTCGALD